MMSTLESESGRTSLRLGHVHLKVSDLGTAVEFYTSLFGLSVQEVAGGYAFLTDGRVHHAVALQEVGPHAAAPNPRGIGLYHVAFEVESEDQFSATQDLLDELGIINQSVDHGISWALYFSDPDGNGLEVYLDRRGKLDGREVWGGQSSRLSMDKHR